MADNLRVTEGTGKYIATQETSTDIHVQLMKPVHGTGTTATPTSASNPLPVRIAPVGQGTIQSVPSGTPNGAALASAPTSPAPSAVRFYLQSSDASVTYVLATSAPGSAPSAGTTNTVTFANYGPIYDEPISGGVAPFITANAGTVGYRYI